MKVSLNQDSWLRSLPSIKSDAKPWNQKINLQKDKKKDENTRMKSMLMMVLMKVRILPKVKMVNDHDDDGGGDDDDINIWHLHYGGNDNEGDDY